MKEKFVFTRGMLILIILIILIIVGIIFGIKFISDNNIEKYEDYEEILSKSAENYYNIIYIDKNGVLDENEEIKVSLSKLISSRMIQTDEDVVNYCNGFVIIRAEKSEEDKIDTIYEPYIKCGKKYSTQNYEFYKNN